MNVPHDIALHDLLLERGLTPEQARIAMVLLERPERLDLLMERGTYEDDAHYADSVDCGVCRDEYGHLRDCAKDALRRAIDPAYAAGRLGGDWDDAELHEQYLNRRVFEVRSNNYDQLWMDQSTIDEALRYGRFLDSIGRGVGVPESPRVRVAARPATVTADPNVRDGEAYAMEPSLFRIPGATEGLFRAPAVAPSKPTVESTVRGLEAMIPPAPQPLQRSTIIVDPNTEPSLIIRPKQDSAISDLLNSEIELALRHRRESEAINLAIYNPRVNRSVWLEGDEPGAEVIDVTKPDSDPV